MSNVNFLKYDIPGIDMRSGAMVSTDSKLDDVAVMINFAPFIWYLLFISVMYIKTLSLLNSYDWPGNVIDDLYTCITISQYKFDYFNVCFHEHSWTFMGDTVNS